jgi:hypothetical protein
MVNLRIQGENMDWLAVMTAIAGVVFGTWFGFKISKNERTSVVPVIEGLQRHVDEAEHRYLEVLRRELSNEIMKDDPKSMRRALDKAHEYAREMVRSGKERIDAEWKAICMQYPNYPDFDKLGTHHFVPYEEARQSMDTNDLVDAYLDTSKMMTLLALRSDAMVLHRTEEIQQHIIEAESKQLDVVTKRRNDRLFNKRIDDAMQRHRIAERAARGVNPEYHFREYEDTEVDVRRAGIEYSPEIGYGIHFKDTDEFGMHTFYVWDDKVDANGYPKITYRNYRSDLSFKKQEWLET